MIKKLRLAELFPFYCFCMVIETGVLYLIIFSSLKDFHVIFLKNHGVYYGSLLDYFCSGVVHFIFHSVSNWVFRKTLKKEYQRYKLAMIASIATYTVLGIPSIYASEYGPMPWFF